MQKETLEKNLFNKILRESRVFDIHLHNIHLLRVERLGLIDAIIVAELALATAITTVYVLVFLNLTDFIGLLLITWLTMIFLLITYFWQVSSK
jgi:hypothetical protein